MYQLGIMASSGTDRDRIWNFQRREYWNDRYQQRLHDQAEIFNESKFDWLCTYQSIRTHVDPYLAHAAFALDIGCGNSDFAAAVCANHPSLHVIGIDYSSALFDLCGSSLGPNSSTEWLVMDARALAMRDHVFDVVFDKGCLDALCAGYDQIALLRSWGRDITCKEDELSCAAAANVINLLRQVERCLVQGGRYICISYEGPSGRQHFFTAATEAGVRLKLVHTAVEEETHNYLYIFVHEGPPTAIDCTVPAEQAAPTAAGDNSVCTASEAAAPKH